MATVYQYDASKYFVGETDDYGGPLPNNATLTPPQFQAGHIPHWTGKKWEQVENHKGETGYVDGKPFTISEYGPYPEGWSAVPPPPPEPTPEELQKRFTDAIQLRLDSFCKTRGYDNTDSMAKYIGCSVPRFATEAAYMRDAVAETWATGYQILGDVMAGKRPMPSIEEVFAELPVLAWPE